MAGLLSSLGTILRYASNVESEGGIAKGTLKTLEDEKVQLLRADGSMMKLLDKYIVEPVVVIDRDLKDLEELDSILGLHMDMFTGYYMQVFDILRDRYGLSVNTVVDSLATDNGGLTRVLTAGLEAGIDFTSEAADNKDYLGSLLNMADLTAPDGTELSLEADPAAVDPDGDAPVVPQAALDGAEAYLKDKAKSDLTRTDLMKLKGSAKWAATGKDMVAHPTTLSSAYKDLLIPNAIQRSIEIKAEVVLPEPGVDGKFHTKTIVIPVTIKLAVIFATKANIIDTVMTQSDEYAFSERLDSYRAGAISLSDFLFAGDIIAKYKKHKLGDEAALIKLIRGRELSANSKMLTNSFAGFEKYYNMYLVGPETKTGIERVIRSKLTTPKGKDKFLEKANGLSVTILDPDHERIQIMLKDIRGKTDLSFKNAVKKDKNGSDYSEIIKALMANKPPAF
ncbi:MAG: hypothetical protein Q9M11_02550 [Mariprofundaceae bacterium]|nr:hypothetical protein [Mariprofundaceae bacterium]